MSWSSTGVPVKLIVLVVVAGAVIARTRHRGEVWHTLVGQNSGTGP
jgi:hypothetical protein